MAYKALGHLAGYSISSWSDGLLPYPSFTALQPTGLFAVLQIDPAHNHLRISALAVPPTRDTCPPDTNPLTASSASHFLNMVLPDILI